MRRLASICWSIWYAVAISLPCALVAYMLHWTSQNNGDQVILPILPDLRLIVSLPILVRAGDLDLLFGSILIVVIAISACKIVLLWQENDPNTCDLRFW